MILDIFEVKIFFRISKIFDQKIDHLIKKLKSALHRFPEEIGSKLFILWPTEPISVFDLLNCKNKTLFFNVFLNLDFILFAVFKNHLSSFWKSFIVEIIFYLENGGPYEFLIDLFVFVAYPRPRWRCCLRNLEPLDDDLSKLSLVVKKVFDQKIEKPLKKDRKIRVVKEGNLNKFGAIF